MKARPVATFVLAHGAGAGSTSEWIVRYAEGLRARGVRVVTFDFPKTRSQMDVLEDAYRDVVERTLEEFPDEPLSIGGKSMGGRIASQMLAKYTFPVRSLVFLGFPLHPPSRPKKRRDTHLATMKQPMLFISGTRDPFASPRELRALATKRSARLALIESGDHSLVVTKASGLDQREVDARIWDEIAAFVGQR